MPSRAVCHVLQTFTPCSPTWDCRTQRLLQPWIWLETFMTQSAVPLEMYGPCYTAQCDSSSITTCGQHCTLLYFLYGNADPRPSGKSLLCSWWWWTVHYTGSERVPIAFEFLAKPAACLSVVKRKKFRRKNPEVSGFFSLHCLLQVEDLKPGCPTLVIGWRCMVRSLTIQKSP